MKLKTKKNFCWDLPKPPKPKPAPPKVSHQEKLIRLLTKVLAGVDKTNAILATGSGQDHVTKSDLKKTETKVMAVLAEVVTDLKEAIVSIKQTNTDIADAQKAINTLNAKIVELEKAIAAGVDLTEIGALAAEVKALAKAADDAQPNPIVVPDAP